MAQGRLVSAWKLARQCPGGQQASARQIARFLRRYGSRGLIPRRVHDALRRARGSGRYAPSLFREESAHLYLQQEGEWLWKDRAGPRWWAYQASLVTRNPEELGALEFLRRQDAEAGLGPGHPFLDVDLIEFVLSLPPEHAFDPEFNRPLLRESLRDVIPDQVRLRKTKSLFNAVIHQAMSGPDSEPARQLLGSPTAEINAYVRPERVSEQILGGPDGHPAGRDRWTVQTWRLLTAEAWLRYQSDRELPQRVQAQWSLPKPECHFQTVRQGRAQVLDL